MTIAALALAPPHQCAPRAGDAAAIEGAVRAMYDALERDDRAAFERQVTSDFSAFDGGAAFDSAQLFGLVADAHRAGKVYKWRVGTVTTAIDCLTAWAKWETRGESGVPPTTMPRHWLESAVFRRSPSGWRIMFFHSTSVPVAN